MNTRPNNLNLGPIITDEEIQTYIGYRAQGMCRNEIMQLMNIPLNRMKSIEKKISTIKSREERKERDRDKWAAIGKGEYRDNKPVREQATYNQTVDKPSIIQPPIPAQIEYTRPPHGYKVLAFGCVHVPWRASIFHPAAEAVFKFAEDWKPDEIIIGGDFWDCDIASMFNKGKPKLQENKRFAIEYSSLNAALDRVCTLAPRIVYLIGNHEYRMTRWLEENPEYIGLLEMERQCHFDRRGIERHEWNEIYTVGRASFLHGWRYNIYHPAAMLKDYGTSIYYWHTHDSFSAVSANAYMGTIEAMSLGCLTDKVPEYRHNKPTRHDHACGIFVFRDDGFYTRYAPILIANSFQDLSGKVYCGK